MSLDLYFDTKICILYNFFFLENDTAFFKKKKNLAVILSFNNEVRLRIQVYISTKSRVNS